jgi:hypothetical protein
MGMQIRIEGQPITLGDLRGLVEQTSAWPADSAVEPRGSRLDTASITVEQPAAPQPEDHLAAVHNTRLGDSAPLR